MDALWRLVWALPLVLLTGAGVALLLRRVTTFNQLTTTAASRMSVQETMTLSDQTRVHLIEVDRQAYLLVESTQTTTLQVAMSPVGVPASSVRTRLSPPWARLFFKARVK